MPDLSSLDLLLPPFSVVVGVMVVPGPEKREAHVYCGNFVGPPVWHGLDYFEPIECNWEADVPLPDDPAEDSSASFVCGGCGATNLVTDHS